MKRGHELCLSIYLNEYNGNLKEFLDGTCDKLNSAWDEKQNEIENVFKSFENSIENAYEIMENNSPFSRYTNGNPNGKFNRSIFELFTFYFSIEPIYEAIKKDKDGFVSKFIQMNDDLDFINAVSGSTKDISNIITRFNAFYNIFIGYHKNIFCIKQREKPLNGGTSLF
mgnify:CR=1 FL=1